MDTVYNAGFSPWAMATVAVFVLAYLLYARLSRRRARSALGSAAGFFFGSLGVWTIIVSAAVMAYLFRDELSTVGQRLRAEIDPFSGNAAVQHADGALTFRVARDNHYYVNANVNGNPLRMLVDTGASAIVLTWEDAQAVGINTDRLTFHHTVDTANGQVRAAPTVLRHVSLQDSVRINNIQAMVLPSGALPLSLLGMSFLSRMASFQFDKRGLTITP